MRMDDKNAAFRVRQSCRRHYRKQSVFSLATSAQCDSKIRCIVGKRGYCNLCFSCVAGEDGVTSYVFDCEGDDSDESGLTPGGSFHYIPQATIHAEFR